MTDEEMKRIMDIEDLCLAMVELARVTEESGHCIRAGITRLTEKAEQLDKVLRAAHEAGTAAGGAADVVMVPPRLYAQHCLRDLHAIVEMMRGYVAVRSRPNDDEIPW